MPVEFSDESLFQAVSVDHEDRSTAYEIDRFAVRGDGGRKRMDRAVTGKLPNLAIEDAHFEELRLPGAVGRKDQGLLVGRK